MNYSKLLKHKKPETNFYDWLAHSKLYGNQELLGNFHDSLRTAYGNIALELLTQSNIDIRNTVVPSKPINKLVPDPEGHYPGKMVV